MLRLNAFTRSLIASGVFACLSVSCYGAVFHRVTVPRDVPEPNGHWVGGYYSNWSYWRGGASIKKLDQIRSQAGSASFVTYAFLGVTNSAILAKKLPYYGGVKLNAKQQGTPGTVVDPEALAETQIKKCTAYPKDYSACAKAAVYPYLKSYASSNNRIILMASIGGWSYTSRFSGFYQDYKKNPDVLNRFIESAKNWLKGHPEYHGFDIDWEYPGYGHGGTPGGSHAGEGTLYTLMMNKLRKMLDQLGNERNRHYYLTSAIVTTSIKAKGEAEQGVDWKAVGKDVDWFNIMAFDINGEFNAAKESDAEALATANPDDLKDAIEYYISIGIPSRKLLLGLPAYAREMLVSDAPGEDNKYGYAGNLHYPGYKKFFNAFKQEYYKDNKAYFAYQDNPNAEPYYPAGGMVDATGAYDYQCFLKPVTGGKATDNCPFLKKLDNRGSIGQMPPSGLHLSSPVAGVAWLSGNQKNIKAIFKKSPASTYPAYPVFTIDTQDVVHYKIENLVKKYKMGGVWFWELSEDALKAPKYALFTQACKDLGENGKCLVSENNIDKGKVHPGLCGDDDVNCVSISNNSGHMHDNYTLLDGKDKVYRFNNMQGECDDDESCVKHVSLGDAETRFIINPTGSSQCQGTTTGDAAILCDVNTLTCNCHPQ